MKIFLVSILGLFLLTGCSTLVDAPLNIVGFSRQDMEAARGSALYQTYQADLKEVFDLVVKVSEEKKYYINIKDEPRGFIALMGIPGSVDTTEVGIFLTSVDDAKGVKLEVSSRSTPAKRTVAQVLFAEMDAKFKAL